MKKVVFACILLAVFAVSAIGEGNRSYNDFWSIWIAPGAQATITPPWETWRFSFVYFPDDATDSVLVSLTHADGDTSAIRLIGNAYDWPVYYSAYGPKISTMKVKLYGSLGFSAQFYK